MADEETDQEPGEGKVVVEIAPDTENKLGKPQLSDEEVAQLSEVPDDEVSRYAKDAQKRIKSLKLVNQEWKRRAFQSSKDLSTLTSVTQQLYTENQELKVNVGRSETALIEQAIQRAEAQLEQAKQRAKIAYSAGDAEAVVSANEEVSRYVAEADRLRLLKPAAAKTAEGSGGASAGGSPPPAPPQPTPVSPGVQAWIQRNPWFGQPGNEEISGFAMGVHNNLEKQGITETSDPEKYWGTIDRRLREVYPQRFKPAAATTEEPATGEQPRRPVAVVGATRVNGAVRPSPRHVTLTESQVRIARNLGLTPEQYAASLVKMDKDKGLVQ